MSNTGVHASGKEAGAKTPRRLTMQQAGDKMTIGYDQQKRDWKKELLDPVQQESMKQDVHNSVQDAFSGIARLGLLTNMRNTPSANWMRSVVKVSATTAAKRLKENARLKSLHRTPYPMVLSRMKLLLDRLQLLRNTGSLVKEGGTHVGASIKSRTSFAETTVTESFRGIEDVGNLETIDDGNGSKISLEKILEELGTTFSYVSEFLRKVPEETRLASILYVKMENFKKDQVVYRIGEEPDKFYIILTGGVEVWTHPPGQWRQKLVIATLRKGQSFGDRAILNNEPRSQCVTASGNSTFLTVEREPFEMIFGSYFQAKLQQAHDFFLNNVEMLGKIPKEDVSKVVRHMLLSTFPAGKEWDPLTEQQIFFIIQGAASLESHDRKFPTVNVSRAMLGLQEDEEEALTLAETGDLANVVLRHGRAIGTLGHEEEMRRLRRQLIPKKAIATLDSGLYFGGGKEVMGDGELQSSLRVLATTDIEVYHCHIHTFFKYASPEIIRALRNDMAFKLTYYYGRIGCLGPYQVVGHPDSDLASQWANPSADDYGTSSQQGGSQGQGGKSPGRRRGKGQKHVHEPGRYAPEVEKAIEYIQGLQAHFEMVKSGSTDHHPTRGRQGVGLRGQAPPIPGHMEFLESKGCTPAERFWATPAVSATARSNAIAPLLGQVFPEGLAPLADKLDELVLRSVRKVAQQASRPGTQGSLISAGPLGGLLGADGPPDQAALEAHLCQLRALAQSPLEHANRSMQKAPSSQEGGHVNSTCHGASAASAAAAAGAADDDASGTRASTASATGRCETGREAGLGPGSVFGRAGALNGDKGFSFPDMSGARARPGESALGGRPGLIDREQMSSTGHGRPFGQPLGASGTRLEEVLVPGPNAGSTAAAAAQGRQAEQHLRTSSDSLSLPPKCRAHTWEQDERESKVGRPGRTGRRSWATSSYPNPNATISYTALLDSKARQRGALMASGVVWARNQEITNAPSLRQCLTYEEIARLRAINREDGNMRPTTAPAPSSP